MRKRRAEKSEGRNLVAAHKAQLRVSLGNSKLGNIPNVSITPVVTCPRGVPCRSACYARRICVRYASVRNAWNSNLKLWAKSPEQFERELSVWLDRHSPNYFRWHVGGDIPSHKYLTMMRSISTAHPKTKFLAFTKNTDLDYSNLPKNMVIRFSMWPGWDLSQKALMPSLTCPGGETLRSWRKLPRAWMDPCNGSKGAWSALGLKHCGSDCRKCKYCWNSTGDVVFKKH